MLGWGLVRAADGRTIDDESVPAAQTGDVVALNADRKTDRNADRVADRAAESVTEDHTEERAADHAAELDQLAHLIAC